jgi:hypothetical protein
MCFLYKYEYGMVKSVEITIRKGLRARCQWLMPIILTIQEAEIRRIAV